MSRPDTHDNDTHDNTHDTVTPVTPIPCPDSNDSNIDNEINLSIFDTRYRNDEGAPAYDPAILLKISKIGNCVTNRGSLDERK